MKKLTIFILLLSVLLVSCVNNEKAEINIDNKKESHSGSNNEMRLKNYGYEGYKIRGKLNWSPDGKYILFEAVKYNSDGKNKHITLLYDTVGIIMDLLSEEVALVGFDWSKDSKLLAIAITNEGLILYNTDTKERKTIDKNGSYPAISPDKNKIAYKGEGIHIYYIGTGVNVQLTKSGWDQMPRWFSDSENLIYIRDLRNYPREILGKGHRMSKLNINQPNRYIDIEPQPKIGNYSGAAWVVPDKKFIMSASSNDDKYKDYLINIEKKSMKEIGEWSISSSERELFIDIKSNVFLLANDSGFIVYDSNLNIKFTYDANKQKEKNGDMQISDFMFASEGRIVFKKQVDEKHTNSIIILNQNGAELKNIAENAIHGAMSVSPEGNTLAVVIDASEIKIISLLKNG